MSSPNEQPCPDCGEMVRINSVRCWNCGAFMNRELEVKYQQMQANPAPMIFSQIPEQDLQSIQSDDVAAAEVDDDDFELTVPKGVVSSGPQTVKSEKPAPSLPVTPAPAAEAKPEADTASLPFPETTEADRRTVSTARPTVQASAEDALLNIALQDELEARQRRARRKVAGVRTVGGGFVIFCPYGCKIEVKEDHRGKQGKCPKCRAPFIVPVDPPMYKTEALAAEVAGGGAPTGAFATWLPDLRVHAVSLEKLKLKADSLAKEFYEADFAFGPDQLLVLDLAKKGGGLFGGGVKKPEVRDGAQKHLREGKPLEELSVGQKFAFSRSQLEELNVVQPAAPRSISAFHGIPVFGDGRIVVQLPRTEASKDPLYVSMGITQFWAFRKALEAAYGITGLGMDCGIPAEPVYTDVTCHSLKSTFKSLEHLQFYKADPTVELEASGYRCGSCSLTISEPGRAKDSLGGKSPKGIAKAKCPKCQQKMGENLLYVLKTAEAPPAATEGEKKP